MTTTYLSKLKFSGMKGPDKTYEFNKDLVLILGSNGAGKTAILQAIHLLLRGKVFRSTGMSSIGNGKDIIKLANPGAKEISIVGEWSDGSVVSRVWKKTGSSVKEFITQNIHPDTKGLKEQQGLLNLHFGNLSEAWEPVEFFNLSSAKMRNKLMMSVNHRPIKDVIKMLPEEMPAWARPGSIEFPAEPWINSALKDLGSKIKEEQAYARHLTKKTELEPEFVQLEDEERLKFDLSVISEKLSNLNKADDKEIQLKWRMAQLETNIKTLQDEYDALEIEFEITVAEKEEGEPVDRTDQKKLLEKEQQVLFGKLKDLGAARAMAEEREEDLENLQGAKETLDDLKSFKEKLIIAQNKLLVTAKKPFEESISKAVGKPCVIDLKNNDCSIMVGGVDVSGLSDGENLRFVPGVVSALAANIESKWLPLPLDRFEAISKDKREDFLRALKSLISEGAISQIFLAGCPDSYEETQEWQTIHVE